MYNLNDIKCEKFNPQAYSDTDIYCDEQNIECDKKCLAYKENLNEEQKSTINN